MTATITEASTSTTRDPLLEAVDQIVGGDILIDLHRAARILGIPGKDALRARIRRGSINLRTWNPGGRGAETYTAAADVYAVLGLPYTLPADSTQVVAHVAPDGSITVTHG